MIPLGGAKQRAVLAMLLLNANSVVSADRLIDAVWGGVAPPRATSTLQVYVSTLRALLEPDRRARPADRMIATRSPGYVIRLTDDQLDLLGFERAATDGRRLLEATDYAAAAEQLRAALELWRGPALADLIDQPFVQHETRGLDERRIAALEARIDADLALSRQAELVPELERLIAEHPLRERLRGQLMLALARSGRQAEALAAYQDARAMLVDELGIDPSPQLEELHHAVLAQSELIRAERSAKPVLLYHDGGGIQRTVLLHHDRSPFTIGRLGHNDLAVAWDPEVSRSHARLQYDDGQWVLHDLSRNGSYINGVRIDRPQPLSDADVVLFGRTAVTFRAPSTDRRLTAVDEYAGVTALPQPLQHAVTLDDDERRVLDALVPAATPAGDESTLTAGIARATGLSRVEVEAALASLYRQFAVDNLPFAERIERLIDRARILGLVRTAAWVHQ